MKKHWRRGLLLGVSIALLLSGGVALAASLSVEAHSPALNASRGLTGLLQETSLWS